MNILPFITGYAPFFTVHQAAHLKQAASQLLGPLAVALLTCPWSGPALVAAPLAERPNIILCMADDQGWGDVGFRGHPVLLTPTLDEMARSSLRLERFYAAAPVCSPTRGSVFTGRHPNRYGCLAWGHSLHPAEITIAEALQRAGYQTGHFGKWHIGSVRPDNPVSPGASGFHEWLSSPNFFESNPLMVHNGRVVKTVGEGSQVTVDAAIEFIRGAVRQNTRFLAVVWFGSPHVPHLASAEDRQPYRDHPEKLQHFYGEITAMDRAIGRLRQELRRLHISENTLFWYNSDNGALPVGSTGGLAGEKGTLHEGGIRVPAIIEWPAGIRTPRISSLPCGTVDIYPTLIDLVGVDVPNQPRPLDGISLVPLFTNRMSARGAPLGFWTYPVEGKPVYSSRILRQLAREQESDPQVVRADPLTPFPDDPSRPYSETYLPGEAAWIHENYKLHRTVDQNNNRQDHLFDLTSDPAETSDLGDQQPQRLEAMRNALHHWQVSVVRSLNGSDYQPAGQAN